MDKLSVIKIGGNIIDDEAKLNLFLKNFAAITGKKILIHGGGKLATQLAAQLNIQQQMVDGRRITDAETLKVVTMVYAGAINKNIVARLQSEKCNAIGISGADGNAIIAHKRKYETIDYGFVGDVDRVNTSFLQSLIENNICPIVAPITHDGKGQLLNTNADTIAQEIAKALSNQYEVSLIYSFEKAGVLLDTEKEDSVISVLTPGKYEELKAAGKIFAGMIPKLDNAFAALQQGVNKVIIGQAENLATLISILQKNAIELLQQLIAIPSFSKEEDKTAALIENFLLNKNIPAKKYLNNVWAVTQYFDESKPTILLNSHHDTVKPNSQYSLDPFAPAIEDGKLFGLGSNDAGGCLVSLLATFCNFYERKDLKYNLLFAASAEEEISGINGIEALLPKLGKIDCAIVGEPTQMQMAVAERGLMVLDCITSGKAGHAARKEGENAIYKALKDIEWFNNYQFSKVSDLLGPVNMTVTVIETENKAHNVVPAQCRFVVDIRVNELYSFEEVLETIKKNIASNATPRSCRLRSTSIALEHPLVKAGLQLNRTYYGSPTTSDKALMFFPALKMGPGDSARSHSANEYIYIHEINEGIDLFIKLLEQLL